MKNKKVIVLLLAIIMTISSIIPTGNCHVSAKIKYSDKITLYVGQKTSLTYTVNFKKIAPKKVKYKSYNKKIATVSKKGVVKAKKKGMTKISGKYKGKVLYVKITVKEKPEYNVGNNTSNTQSQPTPVPINNSAPVQYSTPTPTSRPEPTPYKISDSVLANNISAELKVAGDTLLVHVTNNNSCMVSYYEVNFKLNNFEGSPVYTDYVYGCAINPGETQHLACYVGDKLSDASTYESSVSVNSNYDFYKNANSKINVQNRLSVDGDVVLTYTNLSSDDVIVQAVVVFYDSSRYAVGASYVINNISAGQVSYDTLYANYYEDEAGNYVNDYSDYEVYYYAYSY